MDAQDSARKWLSAAERSGGDSRAAAGASKARDGLRAELRSLVPVAIVGLAAVGIITASSRHQGRNWDGT